MNQRQLKKHSGSAQSQTAAVYLTPTRYCDLKHFFAAIRSIYLPPDLQKPNKFSTPISLIRRLLEAYIAGSANWKINLAESKINRFDESEPAIGCRHEHSS